MAGGGGREGRDGGKASWRTGETAGQVRRALRGGGWEPGECTVLATEGGAGGRRRPRAAEEEPPSRARRATDRGLLTRTGAGPRAPGPGGGRASPHALCLGSSSQRSPRRRGEWTPLLSPGPGPPGFQTTAVSFVRPVSGTPPRTRMPARSPPLPFPAPSRDLGSLEWVSTGRKGREGAPAAPHPRRRDPRNFLCTSGIRQPGGPGMPRGRGGAERAPRPLGDSRGRPPARRSGGNGKADGL